MISARVAILDPSPLVGSALALLLSSRRAGFEVTGVFDSARATLAGVARRPPDLVLINVGAHWNVAADTVGGLRAGRNPVKLALMVERVDAGVVRFVVERRVEGLFARQIDAERLFAGLGEILSGNVVLPSRWPDLLQAQDDERATLSGLSSRQRQVLELLARGRTNEEIADSLFISVNTVKFHVRSIYDRLQVRNRAAATRALSRLADGPAS